MNATVNSNCIGCGLCVSICPEVFEIGDDGLAQPCQCHRPGVSTSAPFPSGSGPSAVRRALLYARLVVSFITATAANSSGGRGYFCSPHLWRGMLFLDSQYMLVPRRRV